MILIQSYFILTDGFCGYLGNLKTTVSQGHCASKNLLHWWSGPTSSDGGDGNATYAFFLSEADDDDED